MGRPHPSCQAVSRILSSLTAAHESFRNRQFSSSFANKPVSRRHSQFVDTMWNYMIIVFARNKQGINFHSHRSGRVNCCRSRDTEDAPAASLIARGSARRARAPLIYLQYRPGLPAENSRGDSLSRQSKKIGRCAQGLPTGAEQREQPGQPATKPHKERRRLRLSDSKLSQSVEGAARVRLYRLAHDGL